jgi:hypothetical protein
MGEINLVLWMPVSAPVFAVFMAIIVGMLGRAIWLFIKKTIPVVG